MKRLAVLGHPIAQSFSPRLHGYWLKKYGIEGSYEAIDTPPENLGSNLSRLAQECYAGVNLTLPLKEIALPLLDEIDHQAQRTGAVNTVVFRDGKKVGYNTDVYGFRENLGIKSISKAVVLGAGGAARAVVVALQEMGAEEIILCNRSEERARELIHDLKPSPKGRGLYFVPWENRHSILAQASLLVNTTSLGMIGQPPLEINLELLPQTALVTDIVYKPITTGLLAVARDRGNPTIDGLGMLLYQGQKAFEHFFGILPEVTEELRQRILT